MRRDSQQWLAQQALVEGGLSAFDVWVVYAGLGGSEDGIQVDAYLNGLLPAARKDRDLIARAINVLLDESADRGLRAPMHSEPAWLDGDEVFRSCPGWDVTPADLIAPLVGPVRAEALRLASLERTGLLRPGGEEEFDAVTREAVRRFPGCSASLALITAEHQVIKSVAGPIGTDGPRATSFCHHTVGGSGAFVVTDATKDERLMANPLVTGAPHIRFYAGYPVRGPGGWRVGSLCVISKTSRGFTPADALSLQELATAVQSLIGVR